MLLYFCPCFHIRDRLKNLVKKGNSRDSQQSCISVTVLQELKRGRDEICIGNT